MKCRELLQSRKEKARAKALLASFRSDSLDDLVFWSFRYFLGRRTIHACCFAEDLARAWPYLDKRVATLIRSELEAAFAMDDDMRRESKDGHALTWFYLGMDCDREAWEQVRRVYTEGEKGNE